MSSIAPGRSVLVANHRRFAPARAVIAALHKAGASTADHVAELLDFATRDVVATLNQLRREGRVERTVGLQPGTERPAAAVWWVLEA